MRRRSSERLHPLVEKTSIIMNTKRIIFILHYFSGIMDAITGLCLIFAPTWTLNMMRVPPQEDAPHLVSYIGTFVFAVGCSHFFAGYYPTSLISRERWRTLWKVSSLVRYCIAGFVLSRVLTGAFDIGWLAVTLTDFTVAKFFSILLLKQMPKLP